MGSQYSLWVGVSLCCVGCTGTIGNALGTGGTDVRTIDPEGHGGTGGGASTGQAGDGGTPVPPSAPTTSCTPLPAIPRRLWRLSAGQYVNSVKALLDLDAAPVLSNRGGSEYAFFSDDSATVDDSLQYALYEVAENTIKATTPQLQGKAACTVGEANDVCARRFAARYGKKAFRRPLDGDELTALMAVYAEGNKQDFSAGLGLMLEALLLSPSFLHRTEIGAPDARAPIAGKVAMTPFEVASQLALFLTDSAPDDALLAKAEANALSTAEQIGAEVDRLLAEASVKQNISRIVTDWFNVRQLEIKPKDAQLLAGQDQQLVESDLLASTRRFVDDALWNGGGKVSDLVTSKKVFVNSRLATIYGYSFSGPPDQLVAVTDERRAGMLTQPSFIWSLSDPAVTSIVKRGKFIHDDVICQDPGPGPGALLDDPAIQAKLATLPTERDKSRYRLQTQPCVGCHAQLDPYALVLENFDPAGRWREQADGVTVDPAGDFDDPLPKGQLRGAVAFADALVRTGLLGSCAVQKIESYAIGRMIRLSDTCEVATVHQEVEQRGGSVANLFRQVAVANFVRERGGAQ